MDSVQFTFDLVTGDVVTTIQRLKLHNPPKFYSIFLLRRIFTFKVMMETLFGEKFKRKKMFFV